MSFYKILSVGEGLFCVATNSSRTDFKIIVDADSCPVKDLVLKVAAETSTPVLAVASISHLIDCQGPGVTVVKVDNIPQAADIAIANRLRRGDIVITGDYGLASISLSKYASVLSPRGFRYTADNIDRLLLQRHIDAKIRRSGGRTKGPKPFTTDDRANFEKALRSLINNPQVNPEESK